ncbi:MAG: rRNA maturation RNAse YbeY [Candidatus Roizmanbacteria bacterium]|nr:rRNA maturation RNAse YbeY [Candidatus Roizmanbacteria bacterium]
MLSIDIHSDSRYKVDRGMVREYVSAQWKERELPEGKLDIAFVGSRKAQSLSKQYLKDDAPHPVLTFPFVSRFPHETDVVGEIVLCFPQVVLYAADQDKEIDKVIRQFLDHAITIFSNEFRTINT